MYEVQALVLAGGKGTRLLPLTENMPKHCLPVGGKPIIRYVLDGLRQNGIEDISLLVDYKHEKVRETCGTAVTYIHTPDQPMVDTIALAARQTDKDALRIVNGDTLYSPGIFFDAKQIYESLTGDVFFLLSRSKEKGVRRWRYGIEEDGRFVSVTREKGVSDVDLAAAIFRTESLLRLIGTQRPVTVPEPYKAHDSGLRTLLQMMLDQGYDARAKISKHPVHNINNLAMLQTADEFVKEHLKDL